VTPYGVRRKFRRLSGATYKPSIHYVHADMAKKFEEKSNGGSLIHAVQYQLTADMFRELATSPIMFVSQSLGDKVMCLLNTQVIYMNS
jgi:hypothetical protein